MKGNYCANFPLTGQGVLLGLSNTAGVLAGVFGTAATGYILQHGLISPLAFSFTARASNRLNMILSQIPNGCGQTGWPEFLWFIIIIKIWTNVFATKTLINRKQIRTL